MEAKTKKGLIIGGVVAGLIAAAYFILKNKHKNPTTNLTVDELKEAIWSYISKANPSAFPASYKEPYMSSVISSSGKPYMDAWYTAIQNNQNNFKYTDIFNRTNNYNTTTGIAY